MVLKNAGFSFIACGITSRSASKRAPITSIRARGVVEITTRDEPFVRLVDGWQRAGRRGEQLHLHVTLADLMQSGAEGGDGFVMRVKQPPLRQQRMHERVADGA